MVLPAVVIGFGSLSVIAILTAFYLWGMEKADTSPKMLGVYAFTAFLGLFTNSMSFIFFAPLGTSSPLPAIQLLFGFLLFIFSIVFLGFSMSLFYNWDLKFVGDAALLLFTFNLIGFIVMFQWMNIFGTLGFIILQLNLFVYLFVEFGFWALTHGKLPAKIQGIILFISGILTYLIVFYTGGIIS